MLQDPSFAGRPPDTAVRRQRIGQIQHFELDNFWTQEELENKLQSVEGPLDSWARLEAAAGERCTNLTFSDDCFAPLEPCPFSLGAAERFLFLLTTLDRLKTCFDDDGKRTPEGHEIYRNFFTGKKGNGGRGAMFSDSSDDEKNKFRKEMTFPCPDRPEDPDKAIFCTWHGKVQTPQLRVHFSSPIKADQPLYVVYAGPKITKR